MTQPNVEQWHVRKLFGNPLAKTFESEPAAIAYAQELAYAYAVDVNDPRYAYTYDCIAHTTRVTFPSGKTVEFACWWKRNG